MMIPVAKGYVSGKKKARLWEDDERFSCRGSGGMGLYCRLGNRIVLNREEQGPFRLKGGVNYSRPIHRYSMGDRGGQKAHQQGGLCRCLFSMFRKVNGAKEGFRGR